MVFYKVADVNNMYGSMKRNLKLASLFLNSKEGGKLKNLIYAKTLLAKADRDAQWLLTLDYDESLNDEIVQIGKLQEIAEARENELLPYEETADIESLMDIIDFGE